MGKPRLGAVRSRARAQAGTGPGLAPPNLATVAAGRDEAAPPHGPRFSAEGWSLRRPQRRAGPGGPRTVPLESTRGGHRHLEQSPPRAACRSHAGAAARDGGTPGTPMCVCGGPGHGSWPWSPGTPGADADLPLNDEQTTHWKGPRPARASSAFYFGLKKQTCVRSRIFTFGLARIEFKHGFRYQTTGRSSMGHTQEPRAGQPPGLPPSPGGPAHPPQGTQPQHPLPAQLPLSRTPLGHGRLGVPGAAPADRPRCQRQAPSASDPAGSGHRSLLTRPRPAPGHPRVQTQALGGPSAQSLRPAPLLPLGLAGGGCRPLQEQARGPRQPHSRWQQGRWGEGCSAGQGGWTCEARVGGALPGPLARADGRPWAGGPLGPPR